MILIISLVIKSKQEVTKGLSFEYVELASFKIVTFDADIINCWLLVFAFYIIVDTFF